MTEPFTCAEQARNAFWIGAAFAGIAVSTIFLARWWITRRV